MAMSPKLKNKLSAAVVGLILAGASAPVILDQFLDEKEGNSLTAYRDGGGLWTICRGATMVDGKPVVQGMQLSAEKCAQVNAIERDKALAWVDRNIKVPLTEPQKAGIASFCPYNIGPGKCFPSTFYKRINAGDRKGACEAIRWWIKDGSQTVSTLIESMASVDGTTTFTVTERLDWSFPNPRVLIRYQDGSASSLMVATSAGDYRVSVPYLATFDDMILDDPGIEPPRLIFCDSSRVGYNALVSEIAPQSDGTCQITAKQYKTSFYDHDNATYPGDTA